MSLLLETRGSRNVGAAQMLAALATLSVLGLNGCPNPNQAFEEFSDRYDKINDVGTGGAGGEGSGGAPACTVPPAGMADGTYLVAISASLNRPKAFALDGTLTTHADGDSISVDLKLQPLSKDDQKTPVGTVLNFTGLKVAADGSFDWDLGMITLVGAANAISGADIITTLQLHGSICNESPDFICGSVTGNVTFPIPLDLSKGKGSAFTMQKYEGKTLPSPVTDCDKTPAKY